MTISDLPALNATLNATCAVLLTIGYRLIRRGRVQQHRRVMIAAFITSTLFLTAPIAGAVVQTFGERRLVVIGLLMQAAGLGWIALEIPAGATYAGMVAPLIMAGVGVSMAMPAAQNEPVE